MPSHFAGHRLVSVATLAPWTTLAACAGLALSDGVLSAITPGYDFAGETSSQLMSPSARYSLLARIFLVSYALLLIPFAIYVPHHFSGRSVVAVIARTTMWVHILAALVSAVALNDSDVKVFGSLTANVIHDNAAKVLFGAALAVLITFALHPRSARQPHQILTYAVVLVISVLGPLFVAEIWTEANGVLERVIGASFMTWLVVTALSWRDATARQALGDLKQPVDLVQ